jgi:hypothetical protein
MELNNYEKDWAWSVFQFGYPDYSLLPTNVLRQVASHHHQEAEKLLALALDLDNP